MAMKGKGQQGVAFAAVEIKLDIVAGDGDWLRDVDGTIGVLAEYYIIVVIVVAFTKVRIRFRENHTVGAELK